MANNKRDDDGEFGSELDLDVGDELDLDLIAEEAAKVERRALRIDFDEVLSDDESILYPDREQGASTLSTDSFLGRKEREALERARGGTPTLKRLGKKAPRPSRPGADGPTLPMDTEMMIVRRGLPRWAWALIAIVSILALALIVGIWGSSPSHDPGANGQVTLESGDEQGAASE